MLAITIKRERVIRVQRGHIRLDENRGVPRLLLLERSSPPGSAKGSAHGAVTPAVSVIMAK